MQSIGAFEAKTHLSRLLDRVAAGEKVTITKHGKPVAMLVPILLEAQPSQPDMESVIAQIHKARRGVTLSGIKIRELIEEGRRF